MKKYIYFITVGFVLIGGIFLSIQFGLKEKSIPKIKLSKFESIDQISESLLMRMRQELINSPILFLGVTPGQQMDLDIANSLIKANEDPLTQFESVLIELDLPARTTVNNAEPIDIKLNHENLKKWLTESYTNKNRTLVIVPHVYATQLIKDSPVSRLVKETKVNFMSITLVPLAYDLNEIDQTYFPCMPEENDRSGLSPLGCAIQKNLSPRSREKLKGARFAGKLEQFGGLDYLFFIKPNP